MSKTCVICGKPVPNTAWLCKDHWHQYGSHKALDLEWLRYHKQETDRRRYQDAKWRGMVPYDED